MIFSCSSNIVEGQCGIGTLKAFKGFWDSLEEGRTHNARNYSGKPSAIDTNKPKTYGHKIEHIGGIGLFGTGFIDTNIMKEVYKWLCDNYKMVYCSPVRKNYNSRNEFFYALFTEHDDDGITPPKWPFGE